MPSELIGYLSGNYTIEEAVELLKRNTRRFAKRQLTWFRRDQRISWISVHPNTGLAEACEEIVLDVEGKI